MKKLTILVVDDMIDSAKHLAKLISEHNFKTFIANDGAEAIQKAEVVRPDLIVLDIQLPSLDGFEVMEEIRKRRIKTRIIMFSGFDRDIGTAVHCIKGGACDFVTKPIDTNQLIARIKRHLITEETLNEQVSKTPRAVVESLMEENESLIAKAERLKERIRQLEGEKHQEGRRESTFTVLSKLAYVAFSLGATFILVRYAGVAAGVSILAAFVMLVLLLVIPWDGVRRLSTAFFGAKADVSMNELRPEKGGTAEITKEKGPADDSMN